MEQMMIKSKVKIKKYHHHTTHNTLSGIGEGSANASELGVREGLDRGGAIGIDSSVFDETREKAGIKFNSSIGCVGWSFSSKVILHELRKLHPSG